MRRSQAALTNPRTEFVVLSVSSNDVLELGLGVGRITLAIGSQGTNELALRCLNRSAESILVFEENLKNLLAIRRDSDDIWCLASDTPPNDLIDVTMVFPTEEGPKCKKYVKGAVQELQGVQLTDTASITLKAAAVLHDSISKA